LKARMRLNLHHISHRFPVIAQYRSVSACDKGVPLVSATLTAAETCVLKESE